MSSENFAEIDGPPLSAPVDSASLGSSNTSRGILKECLRIENFGHTCYTGKASDMKTLEKPRVKRTSSATMQDVATAVGCSKMTVSFALNGTGRISEETRRAVLEAAKRLEFDPNPHAQRLSKGRSRNTIGLFSLWLDFGVVTQKIQFLQHTLNARGFDVPIYGAGIHDFHSEEVQAAAIATIRREKPAALICSTSSLHLKALEELQRYQDEGGILVCWDYAVNLDCDQVIFDREDNTYAATKHLLEIGHAKVGCGFHGHALNSATRVQGYLRALREFGIEPREEWILEGRNSRDYTGGGVTIAQQYLELKDRPTGVAIVNDYAALTFMGEMHRAGIECPRDISLVGHDDYAISRHHLVPLTSVSHPSEAIVDKVAELLFSRLDEGYEGPRRQIIIRGELLVRESTRQL